MPEAFRVDRGALGEAKFDHNGNLIVKGTLTRTGVFSYRHTDKDGKTYTTRELRDPEDVFDAKSIASFAQVPVTDDHPTEGRVTTDNAKRLSVGNLGDTISREGPKDNHVAADLIIRDAKAIDKVMGRGGQPRKLFLSCGYKADVIEEEGKFNGEKYDHRQTNIRGNHVALVRNPRAGAVACLMLDSEDAEREEDGWDEMMVAIEQTVTDALETVQNDDNLDAKQKDALSEKISKIAHEHPEWQNDQVVAVAHKMLGISKKDDHDKDMDYDKMSAEEKKEYDEKMKKGKKDDTDSGEAGEINDMAGGPGSRGGKIIGHTKSGKPVYQDHEHSGHKGFSAEDHIQAVQFNIKRMAEHEGKGRNVYAEWGAAHHSNQALAKSKAKKKDERDDANAGAGNDNNQTRGDNVPIKIKRGPVTIGSGDNELHLDELVVEVDNDSEEPLETLLTQRDELIQYGQDLNDKLDEAKGEAAGWKAKADEATDDPDKLEALTQEREEIMDVASSMGLKRDELRSMRNDEIKRKVVEQRLNTTFKEDDEDGGDPKFIEGVWSTIKADAEKVKDNKQKSDRLHRNANPHREDHKNANPDKGDDDEPKLSYREAHLHKMDGIGDMSDEDLGKRGFN